jgi:hypothetical protein
MGTDRDLEGHEVAEALKRIGREASLISFRRQGRLFCVVIAQTDADDGTTRSAINPDEPATREPWQRANVVLAIEHEPLRALQMAEHRPMPPDLTLWFERATNRYDIGPRAPRHGASGRPEWAARAAAGEAGLWLPS